MRKRYYRFLLAMIVAAGLAADAGLMFASGPVQARVLSRMNEKPGPEDSLLSQVKKLTAADGLTTDQLGWSVAVSGDTAIVGANSATIGPNSNQGAAYIFQQNTGGMNNWGLVKKLTASDGDEFNGFGTSVSISGDTVVVGVPFAQIGTNVDQGAAYIFERNAGGADNWGEVKKLTGGGDPSDQFGTSVSISGDTIIAGVPVDAPSVNGPQGSVYIFGRNNGGANNWGQVKVIFAADGQSSDNFGSSASISGDTVVVGAPLDMVGGFFQQGSAYVFERNTGGANNWGQVKQLLYPEGFVVDFFGTSVAISGNTVIVGIPRAQVGPVFVQGAAYIFERDMGGANNWGAVKRLTTSDGVTEDFGGSSVAIDGDRAVMGVPLDDTGANTDQGSAYVFERNSGGANNWGETQKLTASDGLGQDRFGSSVAVSGSTVVAGAPGDDIGAASNQGSAYVLGNLTTTAAAVSVGGRVTGPLGRGIAGVRVSLTDISGHSRTALTNQFGYYNFEDVQAGESYIFSASSKRYRFMNNPRVMQVSDELASVDFVALETEGNARPRPAVSDINARS